MSGQKIIDGMRDAVAMEKARRLRGLADRVEAGESGPAFDTEIVLALDLGEKCPFWIDRHFRQTPMRITTGLDATEALRVALLPGCRVIEIAEWPGGAWKAALKGLGALYVSAIAPTEPAARLAALLRAYAAQIEAQPSAIETRGRGPLGLD